jgi:hypothetical protein
MSDNVGSISVVFADAEEWPDPIQTYLIERPDELRVYLAQLKEGDPLVIAHRAGESVDLQAYAEVLALASGAGRDVVITVPPSS